MLKTKEEQKELLREKTCNRPETSPPEREAINNIIGDLKVLKDEVESLMKHPGKARGHVVLKTKEGQIELLEEKTCNRPETSEPEREAVGNIINDHRELREQIKRFAKRLGIKI